MLKIDICAYDPQTGEILDEWKKQLPNFPLMDKKHKQIFYNVCCSILAAASRHEMCIIEIRAKQSNSQLSFSFESSAYDKVKEHFKQLGQDVY